MEVSIVYSSSDAPAVVDVIADAETCTNGYVVFIIETRLLVSRVVNERIGESCHLHLSVAIRRGVAYGMRLNERHVAVDRIVCCQQSLCVKLCCKAIRAFLCLGILLLVVE